MAEGGEGCSGNRKRRRLKENGPGSFCVCKQVAHPTPPCSHPLLLLFSNIFPLFFLQYLPVGLTMILVLEALAQFKDELSQSPPQICGGFVSATESAILAGIPKRLYWKYRIPLLRRSEQCEAS